MKALGCFVLVVVAIIGGFFALVVWSMNRGEDQSALTERVQARVIGEPQSVGQAPTTSWKFDYAYEVDGQWYGSTDEGNVRDEPVAPPGEEVTVPVCFDPRDPGRHVLADNGSCGEESIDGGYIDEATPRPAP